MLAYQIDLNRASSLLAIIINTGRRRSKQRCSKKKNRDSGLKKVAIRFDERFRVYNVQATSASDTRSFHYDIVLGPSLLPLVREKKNRTDL